MSSDDIIELTPLDALEGLESQVYELGKELQETQQDLSDQLKENERLELENAKLVRALEAQKPAVPEAYENHVKALAQKVELLESILTSVSLSYRGYHAKGQS